MGRLFFRCFNNTFITYKKSCHRYDKSDSQTTSHCIKFWTFRCDK